MKARELGYSLCVASFLGLSGCASDSPNDGSSVEAVSGQSPGDRDAAADAATEDAAMPPVDAGSSATADPDELRTLSELQPAELRELCIEADEEQGLVGDIEVSCRVEAYALSLETSECETKLSDCLKAGMTTLGLELPSLCAAEPVSIPHCAATVTQMRDCHKQLGDFWASRSCTEAALQELIPSCFDDLQAACPELYGEPDSE